MSPTEILSSSGIAHDPAYFGSSTSRFRNLGLSGPESLLTSIFHSFLTLTSKLVGYGLKFSSLRVQIWPAESVYWRH